MASFPSGSATGSVVPVPPSIVQGSGSPDKNADGVNGDAATFQSLYTDSFDLPKLSYWRVVLTILGYLLLITDVVRSGASLNELEVPTIEPNVFASHGPYVLPNLTLTRTVDPADASKVTYAGKSGTSSGVSTITGVNTRDFKFAPSSYGLRTIWMQRPTLLDWPTCLTKDYSDDCDAQLPLSTVFGMLDGLVNVVRDNANHTTCYKTMMTTADLSAQPPQQDDMPTRDYLSTLPQRVRFAVRAKARWIDGASNFLSHFLLDHKYWMSIWGTHFDDFNITTPGMEICIDDLDRPLLCEKTWADFSRLAPKTGVDKLWSDISDRAAALQLAHPTKKLDMTILETETDPLTLFGGAVVIAHKLYDVIVLYRVQDCTSTCTTVEIHDVRYEGRVLYTDALEWRYITMILRWIGQGYMILRLIFLFVGCYHAVPCTKSGDERPPPTSGWPRLQVAARLFFAIPAQVIVYGSFIPVLFYSSAHVIDGVIYYHIIDERMTSFARFFAASAGDIIRMVAIHTRNIWVAALTVRLFIFIETSGGWTPLAGVTGIKGYLLPVISAGAVLFVLRDTAFEDARILESNEVEPAATFMFIRAETLDSWKMNAGGVYIDILTLFLTCLAYMVTLTVLHWLRRCVRPRKEETFWPQSLCWSRCDVPYAAGYLWDPSCMVVVWENDVVSSVLGTESARPRLQVPSQFSFKETVTVDGVPTNTKYIMGDMQTRIVLMNVAFLSDPWNYVTLKFGHTRAHLYHIRQGNKQRKVLHPYSKPRFLREFEMQHDEVTQLGTFNVADLTWNQVIMCR